MIGLVVRIAFAVVDVCVSITSVLTVLVLLLVVVVLVSYFWGHFIYANHNVSDGGRHSSLMGMGANWLRAPIRVVVPITINDRSIKHHHDSERLGIGSRILDRFSMDRIWTFVVLSSSVH